MMTYIYDFNETKIDYNYIGLYSIIVSHPALIESWITMTCLAHVFKTGLYDGTKNSFSFSINVCMIIMSCSPTSTS